MSRQRAAPSHGHEKETLALYAVLIIDGRKILLAQREIRTLEPVLDVEMAQRPNQGVGWIRFEGAHWPVYAITAEMALLDRIPPESRICVVIEGPDGYFGILCQQLSPLRTQDLRLYALPACMAGPQSPIEALVLQEGVGLITTPSLLARAIKNGLQTCWHRDQDKISVMQGNTVTD